MSRIGRLPVPVPAGVDVTIDGNDVTVKGPKGTLSRTISEPLSVTRQDDGSILVTRPDDERRSRSLHGLSRTLIHNMVVGVTEGYSKRLEIVGTGYRAVQKGTGIELFLGFSHTVVVEAPEGITLKVDGNLKIEVSGISKEQVGEVAANIRKIRPPEPYKGLFISLIWGFWEGFNYVVIAQKINLRYPHQTKGIDLGALICALICLLIHGMIGLDPTSLFEAVAVFILIYGMLVIQRKSGNAWSCILIFCLLWNAF